MPLRQRQEVQDLPRRLTRGAVVERPWRVLAVVAFANLVVAALHFGLAAAAPLLRRELGLDTVQLGLLLSSPALGLMVGTFLWGELADRVSERRVLGGAFVGFALAALASGLAAARLDVAAFGAALLCAGAFGSAAHSAGGRAISAAFAPERHGMVLGIRHTAIPIGAAVGGILVPLLGRDAGLHVATGTFAVLGVLAAAAISWVLPSAWQHDGGTDRRSIDVGRSPLRQPRLWLLAMGASTLAFVQLGIGSFLTVQLVEEAGVSLALAAAVFTTAQLLGATGRVVLGFWSDRLGSRIGVLRGVALVAGLFVTAALLVADPLGEAALLVGALVVVTSCNGVVVAAAAALAPAGRTGATLGMQTTFNAAACTVAPVALGAVIAAAGWAAMQLVLLAALALSAFSLQLLHRMPRAEWSDACRAHP